MSDAQQVVNRLLAVLRHRRWLFILPMLAGMMGTLAYCLFLPRQYALHAILEKRRDPVITNLISSQSPYSFETLRKQLVINMGGNQAIEEAAEQLGLLANFPCDEAGRLTREGQAEKRKLVSRLKPQFTVHMVEQNPKAELIEVLYRGGEPELGAGMVTQLMDNYVTRTRSGISRILNDTQVFFEQEVNKRKDQVIRMEADLIQMAVRYPGAAPENASMLDRQLAEVKKAIEQTEHDLVGMQADRTEREKCLREIDKREGKETAVTQPAMSSTLLLRNPRRLKLQKSIDQTREEIADVMARHQMTNSHPRVVGLQKKLNEYMGALERTPETITSELLAADAIPVSPFESERRGINMHLNILRDKQNAEQEKLAKLRAKQTHLEKEDELLFERRQQFMVRRKELNNLKTDLGGWEKYLGDINQVRVADSGDRGFKFSIIAKAQVPLKPATPKLSGVFMLTGGIGLALGVVIVFLREILDRSIRHPARVRQLLGISVLESIGHIQATQRRRVFGRRNLFLAAAAIQVVAILTIGVMNYLRIERPAVYEQTVNSATRVLWR